MVGSIGPCGPDEPRSLVAGRTLKLDPAVLKTLQAGNPNNSVFPSTAYALVSGATLSLDLGNALYTTSTGGSFLDFGALELAVAQADGTFLSIGPIPYTETGWYEATAGIVSFPLTATQEAAVKDSPLVVRSKQGTVLAEPEDGVFVRADEYVFRLEPGGPPGTTKLYMLRFGSPVSGQTISLAQDASFAGGGPPPAGLPTSALSIPSTVTTGADGTVSVTLTASDPGNPRAISTGRSIASSTARDRARPRRGVSGTPAGASTSSSGRPIPGRRTRPGRTTSRPSSSNMRTSTPS